MSKDLYQTPPSSTVWRIWDPVEQKFCCSGRGLYASSGRSFWATRSAMARAYSALPLAIKLRADMQEFALVKREVADELHPAPQAQPVAV